MIVNVAVVVADNIFNFTNLLKNRNTQQDQRKKPLHDNRKAKLAAALNDSKMSGTACVGCKTTCPSNLRLLPDTSGLPKRTQASFRRYLVAMLSVPSTTMSYVING